MHLTKHSSEVSVSILKIAPSFALHKRLQVLRPPRVAISLFSWALLPENILTRRSLGAFWERNSRIAHFRVPRLVSAADGQTHCSQLLPANFHPRTQLSHWRHCECVPDKAGSDGPTISRAQRTAAEAAISSVPYERPAVVANARTGVFPELRAVRQLTDPSELSESAACVKTCIIGGLTRRSYTWDMKRAVYSYGLILTSD